MTRFIAIATLLSLIFISCEDDKPQAQKDDEKIKDYISQNNLDMTRHSTGVYYKIYNEGSGTNPGYYSKVKVTYKGYLTNGYVFDEGILDYYALNQLITGWQIGLPMIKQGGSMKLIIPSTYGYPEMKEYDSEGELVTTHSRPILVFDLTLIDHR